MSPKVSGICWRCGKYNEKPIYKPKKYNWCFCDRPCGAVIPMYEVKNRK